MKKKAIAPVISTFVLILFATGLGIIVMNWGSTAQYIEEPAYSCDKTSIHIIEINNEKDVCIKDNNFYFTLENDGETTVNSLRITFIGDIVFQTDSYEKYYVGDIKKESVRYEVGPLLKVKISPVVEGKVCQKKSISIENIPQC